MNNFEKPNLKQKSMQKIQILLLILLFFFISSCSIALVVSAMSLITKNVPIKSDASYVISDN